MRRDLHETEAFERAKTRREGQLARGGCSRHPREVLIVVGLTAGGTLAFYTYTTYMQKFLVNTVGLSDGHGDHDGRRAGAVRLHAACSRSTARCRTASAASRC